MSQLSNNAELELSSIEKKESKSQKKYNPITVWKTHEKIAFRIAFIFFSVYSIPWDPGFYAYLFNIDYANLNYKTLTSIVAFFNPHFINIYSASGFFGLAAYVNIPFVLLIAIIGAIIWGYLDKDAKEYNKLYYWVRVLARYRVAYGVIAWGYKKIFIMQMPFPNVGLLHTDFIDFFAKRLYWEGLGISPHYEVFLGFAEFIPGFLLLFRKTSTLGAALAMVVLGNVAIANHAYDIGEAVPAFCLSLLSFFILWYDLPRIIRLLVNQKDEQVVRYYPTFNIKWQKYTRLAIKWTFNGIFVVFFGISEIYGFTHNDFYKIPNTTGLPKAKGFYNVTEFRLNNKIIPYSPLDTLRWHDATFEDWSSLSFKVVNRPDEIEMFAASSYPRRGEPYDGKWYFGLGDHRRFPTETDKKANEKAKKARAAIKRDLRVNWELSGIGSDRKWYYYEADTVNKILYLQNKNRARRDQKQVLHYSRPTESRIILSGTNEFKDSIYVVLDKVNEVVPLLSDGRKPVPDWLDLKK